MDTDRLSQQMVYLKVMQQGNIVIIKSTLKAVVANPVARRILKLWAHVGGGQKEAGVQRSEGSTVI